MIRYCAVSGLRADLVAYIEVAPLQKYTNFELVPLHKVAHPDIINRVHPRPSPGVAAMGMFCPMADKYTAHLLSKGSTEVPTCASPLDALTEISTL
jgi:hypothetical protein